jgi:rhodanese-related sulfurtransferase
MHILMETPMPSSVAQISAAPSSTALAHFEQRLAFETDCWNVHSSLAGGEADFVLVDVRSPSLYAKGHARGAINIPHRDLTEARLAAYPKDTLFVVYCAGPHCNGANKAALRLARLGRPVKEMIGGVTGWLDEGFELVREAASVSAA